VAFNPNQLRDKTGRWTVAGMNALIGLNTKSAGKVHGHSAQNVYLRGKRIGHIEARPTPGGKTFEAHHGAQSRAGNPHQVTGGHANLAEAAAHMAASEFNRHPEKIPLPEHAPSQVGKPADRIESAIRRLRPGQKASEGQVTVERGQGNNIDSYRVSTKAGHATTWLPLSQAAPQARKMTEPRFAPAELVRKQGAQADGKPTDLGVKAAGMTMASLQGIMMRHPKNARDIALRKAVQKELAQRRKEASAPPAAEKLDVNAARRVKGSAYGVDKDMWGDVWNGKYQVNHGYYGLSANDKDNKAPGWVTGNSLEAKDAQRLNRLRDEVSHAVLHYYEETKEGPHALGAMLFGWKAGQAKLRLIVKPNADGSFDITPRGKESPWHATIRAGEVPHWQEGEVGKPLPVSKTQPKPAEGIPSGLRDPFANPNRGSRPAFAKPKPAVQPRPFRMGGKAKKAMQRGTNKDWGNVKLGDRVTSKGRHGAGQPAIEGTIVAKGDRDTMRVKLKNGQVVSRSARNLRPFR
jgi:hypothetical protein